MQEFKNISVLILAYNRYDKFLRCFETLHKQGIKKIFISIDGPKNENDLKIQKKIYSFCKNNLLDLEIKCNFLKNNYGCRLGPIKGITWFFKQNKYGIILEDDLIVSGKCIEAFSYLLEKNKNNKKFMSISSFNEFTNKSIESIYALPVWRSWGWACWADRWAKYDVEMKSYKHSEFAKTFKSIVSDPSESLFWSNIFYKVSKGKIDTWDYQWVYTSWKNNGLSIEPNVNLVSNIGFGEESTHTRDMDSELANMNVLDLIFPLNHPNSIERNIEADLVTAKKMFLNPNFFYRALRRLLIELKILIKKIKSSNQNIS